MHRAYTHITYHISIKMRPVAVSRVLGCDTRPQRSGMQCQFHTIHKQVVITTVLHIVKSTVVYYLPYYFFYSASDAVEHMVVPALKWESAMRAFAFSTGG